MFLESKLIKLTIDGRGRHEVFWQYLLVTSSQLGSCATFDGLDLRFGSFLNDRCLSHRDSLTFYTETAFLQRSSVSVPA